MAFRASLKFEDKVYDVLQCDYSFERDTDDKGRPASNVYGGLIMAEVESTDDTTIFRQMVNQFKPNSGVITFNRGDEEAKMKELKWENGYIVEYTEVLDTVGLEPMKIIFKVSAEKIAVDNAEVNQEWPK